MIGKILLDFAIVRTAGLFRSAHPGGVWRPRPASERRPERQFKRSMPPAATRAHVMRRCTSWARLCGTAARNRFRRFSSNSILHTPFASLKTFHGDLSISACRQTHPFHEDADGNGEDATADLGRTWWERQGAKIASNQP